MAQVTVRNLPEETHRALRIMAAMNGRSTESELRYIIEAAIRPSNRLKLGSALAKLANSAGLIDNEIIEFEKNYNTTPSKPLDL